MSNMGVTDRWIRAALGACILALVFFGGWGFVGAWGWIATAIAAVLLLTSAIGVCPAYLPFGITTCQRRS